MNILILSREGNILGIAERLVRYGHKVDMFIQNPKMFKAGSGLMNRVISWRPSLKGSDLVICDGRGFGKFEEVLRGNGRPVLGCSRVADYLQESYTRRLSILRGLNLKLPKVFALPESIDKIDWDLPWNLLASNGVGSRMLPRPQVFDLHALLRSFPSSYSCYLVEENEGVSVTVSGWWNGRGWVKPFCYTFMTDYQPAHEVPASMGCVTLSMHSTKLSDIAIKPLERAFTKFSYRGPVHVNLCIRESTIVVKDFTLGFIPDQLEAFFEGVRESIADFLFDVAAATAKDSGLSQDYLISVSHVKHPWPIQSPEHRNIGLELQGVEEGSLKHLFLFDVYKKDKEILYAAESGLVFKAAARGRSLAEARRRVFDTLSNVKIYQGFSQANVGASADNDFQRLRTWGW